MLHTQRVKRYREKVFTRIFLYVLVEHRYTSYLIRVSPFGDFIFSQFYLKQVLYVPYLQLRPVFSFFPLVFSFRGNKNGFNKSYKKTRHEVKDTSITDLLLKKICKLRKKHLFAFCR